MPDFGLTEALSKALAASKSVPVMRPAEQELAAQAAKAAPAAAAPAVPEAARAPSVQTPSSTPTGVQAPPLDPSVQPADIPAPPPTQTPAEPAPPPEAAAGGDAPPPTGAVTASEPVPQAPAPAPTDAVAPADKLPPGIPAPPEAPAAPVSDVQAAAQRFVTANIGDFEGKLNMTHMPNVDVISSPDGWKAGLLQLADDNKDLIEAARGKAATNAQTIGLAQDLSISVDTLTQRFDQEFGPETVENGDQRRAIITAARITEQNEVGTALALSDKVAKGTATSAEIIEWQKHTQAIVSWRTRLAGANAEAGRNLQILGAHVNGTLPPEVLDHIAQVLKQNNPDIQATANAIKLAGTPSGIVNILAGLQDKPLWLRSVQAISGFIQRTFINGILSGPPTWKTIFVGNNFNLALNAFDLYTAGIGRGIYGLAARLGGFPTAEEGVQLSDAFAYTHGVISAGADALRVAGRVLKTGVTLENLSGKQISRVAEGMNPNGQRTLEGAIPELQNSFLGRVAAAVEPYVTGEAVSGRAIGAIDQFTQTLGYRGWVTMRSLQEIRARLTAGTLKPGDAESAMLDMMRDQSPEMQQEATAWAARQTFQTPFAPGGSGEAFTAVLNKAPALRFIFPFMRTATNIVFKQALAERSLLGLFSSRIRSELTAGGVTGDLARSKMATGTAIASMYAWMAIHDRITGSAPKDPKERGDWALDGRTPYSVRVTNPLTGQDTWRSFNEFEPQATLAGAVADAVTLHAYIAGDDDTFSMLPHEDRLTEARNLIVASIITNTGNKSFMQGAAQFSEMYNDPKRAFDMWANEAGASLVPYSGMTKFIRNEQDPYLRQALTLMDKIRDDLPTIPGALNGSKTLMPRLDVFGEPRVRQGGNSVLGPLNPLPSSDSKKDNITDEIQSLMEQTHVVPVTMPTKLLALDGAGKGMQGGGGMRLTPEEYYDYVRFSRSDPVFDNGTQTFRERLEQTMNLPVYKAATPPMQVELLGQIARDADRLGAVKLYHENTDFRERMTAWTAEMNRQKFNK